MSRVLYDNKGRPLSLESELGRGGEGAVYEINVSKNHVAKIYTRRVSSEKAKKLSLMLRVGNRSMQQFSAWPVATVHDRPQGETVGLIMQKVVAAKEIHELYSPAHRKVEFPSADWRFLVRTAMNCALAFESLHSKNIVVADVNQGNVLVNKDATIRLIDCDSFQIESHDKTIHKCRVGVAHFTPPELTSYEVVRSFNHDNFGLAVLIFHLLFMGRHPYSGKYLGKGDMPLETAIKDHRFAYGQNASRFQMSQPPNTLALDELPPEISRLFEAAFADPRAGVGRPTAAHWHHALNSLESGMKKCSADPGHFYYNRVTCPWCRIAGSGGPNFFISVSIKSIQAKDSKFDIQRVFLEIRGIARPGDGLAKSKSVNVNSLRAKPIPDRMYNSLRYNADIRYKFYRNICIGLSAFIVMITAFEAPLGFSAISVFVWLGWYVYSVNNHDANEEINRRNKVLQDAKTELDEQRKWSSDFLSLHKKLFDEKMQELLRCRSKYESLKSERNREYAQLQNSARESQLDAFLESIFISRASIVGIGPSRQVTLESHGIETASDISYQRVSAITGFGPSLTSTLVDWRKQMEVQFTFDPSKGVPASAVQKLDIKYAQLQTSLQAAMLAGKDELRKISRNSNSRIGIGEERVAQLLLKVKQAELDANYQRKTK